MCLLFFSYRTTPGFRLVVAANRDEFLDRPTAPLAYFDDQKAILAGRDLQGGGTWLGVSASQRIAALTNYRDPASNRADAPSRGRILTDYLTGDMTAETYLQSLAQCASQYNGFNLILGDSQQLFCYSNKAGRPECLSPGFYGLSNHLLDTPWPKVVRGKKLLRPYMVEAAHVDPLLLIELLTDNDQPPDDQLPETGVGRTWERLLGTIYIDAPGYGTRSSAVITISDKGIIEFTERTVQRSPGRQGVPEIVQFTLNGKVVC